jgi:hypothetical protein
MKKVNSGNPLRMWNETTTLHTRVLRGHAVEDENDIGEAVAAGTIRLSVPSFLKELTTFRMQGPSPIARAAGLGGFGVPVPRVGCVRPPGPLL